MTPRASTDPARARRLLLLATAVVLVVACGSADRVDDGADRDGAPRVGSTTPATDAPVTSSPSTTTPVIAAPTTPTTPSTPAPATPAPIPVVEIGDPVVVAVEPVDIAVRPGTDEIYVAERLGTVRRIEDGGPGPALIDVTAELEPGFEEGLLGITFSPDGRHLYIQTTSGLRTTVWAYPVLDDGSIDVGERRDVFGFDQPYEAHNGGDLAFGPDGFLYVFSGDGGFVADPERRALDLSSYLGKLHRIDPTPDGPEPYRVPADNPFVGVPDALDEIWSYGLRNPWRGSFDPRTGDLWIGDVGDFAWEEVNVAWADEGGGRGLSFGWSAFEGSTRFNEDQPAEGHEFPFFEYPHGEEGCSITAGERYRGVGIPDLQGWFVFSDFCSGVVRALEVLPDRSAGRLVELGVVPTPVSVRAGPGDELYVVSLEGPIHPVVAG